MDDNPYQSPNASPEKPITRRQRNRLAFALVSCAGVVWIAAAVGLILVILIFDASNVQPGIARILFVSFAYLSPGLGLLTVGLWGVRRSRT
jgi:hypothetical protein